MIYKCLLSILNLNIDGKIIVGDINLEENEYELKSKIINDESSQIVMGENIIVSLDINLDEELIREGLYDKVSQAFAVLLPVKSVGVMGDERTYEETCVLRCINSVDGMTADVTQIDIETLSEVATHIINKVPRVNKVLYDITSKPPSTIEWE